MSAYEGYTGEPMEKWERDYLQQMREKRQAEIQVQTQGSQGLAPGWSPLAGQLGHAGQNANHALNPKRAAELPSAAATLNERVEVLMRAISELETRLESVLRPAPPATVGAGMAQQAYGANTQLGIAISGATLGIDGAANRVRDLLDRLEL